MTIEEMKIRKKELGYSNKMLAEKSGVPLGTVQKIFGGSTTAPRRATILALSRVLAYAEALHTEEAGGPSMVMESSPAYGRSFHAEQVPDTYEHTIDEYIALPEGTRVELIDGRFYDMSAPSTIHQAIGMEIWHAFKSYIIKNKGMCMPFVAPTDVQLDCDNKTMVMPDVLVVCDRSKITKARIVGAPDLVVEIVSLGNVITDVLIKMRKYQNAGVREYWIVFPDEKQIMAYDFEHGHAPQVYSFDDCVPVSIWDGKCMVDFAYIYSQVEFMY
ncbi:MAG: Uma2 family endonuclease [Lachnospiraceae bacterium]|nr:Uma2 family endonuclease [Lachnospiraceae bacterium]